MNLKSGCKHFVVVLVNDWEWDLLSHCVSQFAGWGGSTGPTSSQSPDTSWLQRWSFFSPLDNLERFGNQGQPCFQFCTDSETAPEGFTVTYVLEWTWQLHTWRGKLLASHLLATWFFNSCAAHNSGFNSDCCLMYYLVDLSHLSSSVKHSSESVCVFKYTMLWVRNVSKLWTLPRKMLGNMYK